MLPELLQTSKLFQLLHRIDIDLADQQQRGGCPHCSGPLHYSNYLRKPRGGPGTLPYEIDIRLSLCCANEGCRRRTLPPSTLFMDRKVYFRSVILIVLTLRHNKPQEYSKARLIRLFGISRKTINRWLVFFSELFPRSNLWKMIRGRISSSVQNNNLPGSLVNYFLQHIQTTEEAIINCNRLLATNLLPIK